MPMYKCKIRQDRVDAFKKNWTQPQAPEKWIEHVEAGSEGDARSNAYDLFGAVIADNAPDDFSKTEAFSPAWFECVLLLQNQD